MPELQRAVAGREELLLRSLGDPSMQVRSMAIGQVARRCRSAKDVVQACLAAAPDTRARLCAAISTRRRRELAQPLAEALLAQGDLRAARPLIEWCDEDRIRKVVGEFGVRAVRWARISAHHPQLTLGMLQAELETAGSEAAAGLAWGRFDGAFDALCRTHPKSILELWERFGPSGAFPTVLRGCWAHLLRSDAAKVAQLSQRTLENPSRPELPNPILRHARLFPVAALDALSAALSSDPDELATFLGELPPSQRAARFEAAFKGKDTAGAVWSGLLMKELPHATRHAEARRMLALSQVRRSPEELLALTAWLPVDEALERLTAETRASKGEDRARGWSLRIACNASNRRGLTETLEAMKRLANEQDPVRLSAFEALAQVPTSLFEPAHSVRLLELVGYVVDARDTSSTTRAALFSLARKLLVAWAHDPAAPLFEAGLKAMLRLAEHRPVLDFPSFEHGLRRGAEQKLVDVLVPWLRKEVERELNVNVLNLAAALGKRARGLTELQELLEEIVFTARTVAGDRQRAATLWLDDPARRDERVRRILDGDESAVTLAPVWLHLHRRRQDWLDPFVQGRRLSGRFASSKAGWLFPAVDGFAQWLPRQQVVFAKTLREVIDDKGQHAYTRAQTVLRLAAIPATTVAELAPLTKHAEVNVAEGALGGLVWLDEPVAALPVLLENLDSDRARVAMYALPRLARLVPGAALLETLQALLARPKLKVTVHKEAVRLLGGVLLPAAGTLLASQWALGELHRDVRIALVHAARRRLDEEGSWTMLRAAQAHPERDVARTLLEANLLEIAPGHRKAYAEVALGLALHPSLEIRTALLDHLARPAGWGRVAPGPAAVVAGAALLSQEKDSPWQSAACALAALASAPEAMETLESVLSKLAAGAIDEPLVAKPEDQDLPDQRRLELLCSSLCNVASGDRARTRNARARAIKSITSLDPWLWDEKIALTLADLPVDARALPLLTLLADGAPGTKEASELERAVARWAQDKSRPCTAADLLALAGRLVKGNERWAALGLADALGSRFGWSSKARTLLAELRSDPATSARARRIQPQ